MPIFLNEVQQLPVQSTVSWDNTSKDWSVIYFAIWRDKFLDVYSFILFFLWDFVGCPFTTAVNGWELLISLPIYRTCVLIRNEMSLVTLWCLNLKLWINCMQAHKHLEENATVRQVLTYSIKNFNCIVVQIYINHVSLFYGRFANSSFRQYTYNPQGCDDSFLNKSQS